MNSIAMSGGPLPPPLSMTQHAAAAHWPVTVAAPVQIAPPSPTDSLSLSLDNNMQPKTTGNWREDEIHRLVAHTIAAAERDGKDPYDRSRIVQLPWTAISGLVRTRDAKQCRERWENHEAWVKQDKTKRKIVSGSKEANHILWLAHTSLGRSWANLSRRPDIKIPENSLKNFYNQEKSKWLKTRIPPATGITFEQAVAIHGTRFADFVHCDRAGKDSAKDADHKSKESTGSTWKLSDLQSRDFGQYVVCTLIPIFHPEHFGPDGRLVHPVPQGTVSTTATTTAFPPYHDHHHHQHQHQQPHDESHQIHPPRYGTHSRGQSVTSCVSASSWSPAPGLSPSTSSVGNLSPELPQARTPLHYSDSQVRLPPITNLLDLVPLPDTPSACEQQKQLPPHGCLGPDTLSHDKAIINKLTPFASESSTHQRSRAKLHRETNLALRRCSTYHDRESSCFMMASRRRRCDRTTPVLSMAALARRSLSPVSPRSFNSDRTPYYYSYHQHHQEYTTAQC